MRRRDLSKAILASAAGSMLATPRLQAQNTAVASQAAHTAAESAARVTPTDTRFPPGDVRRYGARGDGVSDDTPAFQAAIDVARLANRGSVYAPVGAAEGIVRVPAPEVFYLLAGALNCTFGGTANQHGITLRGEAGLSPGSPAIIARHRGHVFDLTGCESAVFEDLNIGTDSGINPQTCFFLARNRSRSSAGFHRFRNVRVHGKFTTAILYNYGSESNVYSECVWYNESTAPATKVAVFSSHNIFGLHSGFEPVASGAQSCLDHQILGGQLCNTSGDAAADVLYLDAVGSLKIFGPWMSAGVNSHGRALLYVDSTNGASGLGLLFGVQGEVGNTQQYGLYFADQSPSIPSAWTIDGCFLPNAKQAIFAAANTTLDRFHISNLHEAMPHGLLAAVVQNSTIAAGTLPLSIGTSRRNALIGDSSRWRIGAREHDYWIDSGAANKAWSPDTRGLKVSGRLVIAEASCVFHGPLVTLTATLTASSIECASGATITGLPAAARVRSALVSVCDADSGAALGSGLVAASTIVLPAISPRKSIVVSASYFTA